MSARASLSLAFLTAAPADLVAAPAATIRVLVVEDDAVDRLALRRHIAHHGLLYDLTEAASVAEGRAWLARRPFDVLVLDCHLPDGSGFDLCRNPAGVPVVFVTGSHDLATAVRAVRAGAADFLLKDRERDYLPLLPVAIDRTVREARARALIEAGHRLCSRVFTCAPLPQLLVSDSADIVRANHAAARLFGLSPEELEGAPLARHLPEALCAAVRGGLVQPADDGCDLGEFALPVPAGPPRRVRFHLALVRTDPAEPPAALLQIQDVTALRDAEAGLRYHRAELQRVLEAIPAAVIAHDEAGRASYLNPAAAALLGEAPSAHPAPWARDLPLARPPPDGSHPLADALAAGRPLAGAEFAVARPDGERTVLAYSTRHAAGSIVVLVDVTGQKELERRQRILAARLEDARRIEALGTLASGVAHEFNNLLTAIIGNQQLAGMELPLPHPARPFLDASLDSCRRAGDLVQRMLRLSRESEVAPTPVSLRQVIADALPAWRAALRPGLRLEVRLPAACPPIFGHPPQLAEGIFELLQNAAEVTPVGVAVELELGLADLPPAHRAAHPGLAGAPAVCLLVRDQGPGIDTARFAHLFEPFYTTKAPGAGPGLGLATVYWLVKRHHGAILVDSDTAGTAVRLFFPAAGASAPSAPAVQPDHPAPRSAP